MDQQMRAFFFLTPSSDRVDTCDTDNIGSYHPQKKRHLKSVKTCPSSTEFWCPCKAINVSVQRPVAPVAQRYLVTF